MVDTPTKQRPAPQPQTQTRNNDKWSYRRKYMFATLVFSMGVVAWCLYKELDNAVAEVAVTMAFVIIGTTISSYVFGAAWQDVNAKDWMKPGASSGSDGFGPTGMYYGDEQFDSRSGQ